MRCDEHWCSSAFFWVVIWRRSRLPAALTPTSHSSSTSWLSFLISCTPALPRHLWQPLLPHDGTSNHCTEPRLKSPGLTPVISTHVTLFSMLSFFNALWLSRCSCPVFPRSGLRLISPSRSCWGKRESGEWPCGIMSRTAVPPSTVSRRSYAKCLITRFRELRQHEPWHCYDRKRVQFPVIRILHACGVL